MLRRLSESLRKSELNFDTGLGTSEEEGRGERGRGKGRGGRRKEVERLEIRNKELEERLRISEEENVKLKADSKEKERKVQHLVSRMLELQGREAFLEESREEAKQIAAKCRECLHKMCQISEDQNDELEKMVKRLKEGGEEKRKMLARFLQARKIVAELQKKSKNLKKNLENQEKNTRKIQEKLKHSEEDYSIVIDDNLRLQKENEKLSIKSIFFDEFQKIQNDSASSLLVDSPEILRKMETLQRENAELREEVERLRKGVEAVEEERATLEEEKEELEKRLERRSMPPVSDLLGSQKKLFEGRENTRKTIFGGGTVAPSHRGTIVRLTRLSQPSLFLSAPQISLASSLPPPVPLPSPSTHLRFASVGPLEKGGYSYNGRKKVRSRVREANFQSSENAFSSGTRVENVGKTGKSGSFSGLPSSEGRESSKNLLSSSDFQNTLLERVQNLRENVKSFFESHPEEKGDYEPSSPPRPTFWSFHRSRKAEKKAASSRVPSDSPLHAPPRSSLPSRFFERS